MKKISNSEEANQYYGLVNEYIDEYITKNNITPKNLKKYLNGPKLESFLRRYNLDEIDGIKRVISNVIDDWCHIQDDKVMKFENFLLTEEVSSMDYERVLADFYHTSVGHIWRDGDNRYKVSDFGKKVDVIIYSKEDAEKYREKILPEISKLVYGENIKIEIPPNTDESFTVELPLEKIVDSNKLSIYLKDIINTEIIKLIGSKIGKEYSYIHKYRGYHIWEKK